MLFGRNDRCKYKWQSYIAIGYIICILLFTNSSPFAQNTAKPSAIRSRAFKLRHITSKDCKKQLELLEIADKIDLLGDNALILTSTEVANLAKASEVVTLIDSKEKYVIKELADWSGNKAFTYSSRIETEIAGITVGTFSDPPTIGGKNGTIVDIHNSKIVAITPAKLIDSLSKAVADLIAPPATPEVAPKTPEVPEKAPTPKDKPLKSEQLDESDFFQAELFKSLADAELKSKAGEEKTEPAAAAPEKSETAPDIQEPQAKETKAPVPAPKPAADPNAKAEQKVEEVDPENDKMLELLKALQKSAQTEETAAAETMKNAESKVEPIPQPQTQPLPIPPLPTTTPRTTTRTPVRPIPTPKVTPKVIAADPQAAELAAAKAEIERLQMQLEGKDALPKPPAKSADTSADQEDAIVPEGEEQIQTVITLPEKIELSALIELVGKQLKINYMYDPTKIPATEVVMLKIHDGKIKVKDMYALLESVLKFKGYVMTRRGNLVTILKGTDASSIDPVIREDSDEIQPGDVVVTSIYKLEHISVAAAQTMLTNMDLGLSFIPIEDTKTLIVTEYAYRIERIEKVLQMIDVKGEDRKFISRKLKYLLPSELAAKLQTLAEELGTISITIGKATTTTPPATASATTLRRPTPTRSPVRTTVPTPATTAAKQGVYIDTDDRTNSILMIGLEEDLQTVNMLVESLDVEKYGLKSIKEYQIQYIEATEVLDSLSELGVIASYGSSRQSPYSSTPTRTTPTSRTTPTRTTTPTTRTPTGYGDQTSGDQPDIAVRLATNSLLVNATAEQHKEIEMVIKFVDVEQEDLRSVREYEIQYVDSSEIVDTLAELGIIEQKASSASSQRRTSTSPTSRLPVSSPAANAPEAPQTTTFAPTTGAEITSDQPQIAVLESTNSLLVYATPKQHETIALVVAHVDRELTEISTPYVIYALENQDPDELVAILNDIVQATIKEAEQPKDSKITTAVSSRIREKNEIQIVSDPKTYSLIVYADKKNQQWLSALIEELDAYRPQVLLGVTLAEIRKTDDFTLDLQNAIKTAGGPTFDLLSSGGLLNTFPSAPIQEATVLSGQFQGFLADEHVQVLIDAIQKKTYGRILSRPTLLVDDNQEGTLDAKETNYVARSSSIINPGSATGQTTTSTNTVFEAYDAGISLAIKPHISKGDNLRLEITLSQSEFDKSTGVTVVDGIEQPKPFDTTINDIVTVVTVPDSSTIILGGLEKISQGKGGSKVPFLGDIPILGVLFRRVDNTDSQRKLYVFIKARIMRPGTDMTSQDLIDISQRSKGEFEARENEMQEYQDMPGFKPKIMPPVHVLEEDDFLEIDETY